MAVWLTNDELKDTIGERSLTDLADLEGNGLADATVQARITGAIGAADDEVKSFLRGRLDIDSISTVPPVLKRFVVILATAYLQEDGRRETTSDRDAERANQVRQWLKKYANGEVSLGHVDEDSSALRDTVVLVSDFPTDLENSKAMKNY